MHNQHSHNFNQDNRNDGVTNRQSDFEQHQQFNEEYRNMPYENEGYGNPYTDMHQHNDVYSNYHSERFRNQQPYNWEDDMRMEQRGRNIDRDWNELTNWANDVQRRNNMRGNNIRHENNYMNPQNGSNFGETYNPQNRNFNPMFADDEGGFSGGHNSEFHRSGYNRDFGFDRGNSFYDRHPQLWSENDQFRNSDNEGRNRWNQQNNSNSSQNRGGFFGH